MSSFKKVLKLPLDLGHNVGMGNLWQVQVWVLILRPVNFLMSHGSSKTVKNWVRYGPIIIPHCIDHISLNTWLFWMISGLEWWVNSCRYMGSTPDRYGYRSCMGYPQVYPHYALTRLLLTSRNLVGVSWQMGNHFQIMGVRIRRLLWNLT
jgi:hypothetical protein